MDRQNLEEPGLSSIGSKIRPNMKKHRAKELVSERIEMRISAHLSCAGFILLNMIVLADTEIDPNRFRVNAGERRPVSHPADAVHLQVLTCNSSAQSTC